MTKCVLLLHVVVVVVANEIEGLDLAESFKNSYESLNHMKNLNFLVSKYKER